MDARFRRLFYRYLHICIPVPTRCSPCLLMLYACHAIALRDTLGDSITAISYSASWAYARHVLASLGCERDAAEIGRETSCAGLARLEAFSLSSSPHPIDYPSAQQLACASAARHPIAAHLTTRSPASTLVASLHLLVRLRACRLAPLPPPPPPPPQPSSPSSSPTTTTHCNVSHQRPALPAPPQ